MAKAVNKREAHLADLKPIRVRPHKAFAEKNAAEFLEGNGLVEAEKAAHELENWPTSKIEVLCNDLFDFLEQQRSDWEQSGSEVSPFNCLASSSIRGDSGCSNPKCRAAKLDVLANFAAMYADQVFLPVPLRNPAESLGNEGLRSSLIQTVTSVLELRALVERSIVRPVMRVFHYCSECAQLAMSEYREGEKTIATMAAMARDDFRFSYQLMSEEPRVIAVRLRGPEGYIEHGSMYRILSGVPQ